MALRWPLVPPLPLYPRYLIMSLVWNYAVHGICFGPSNMKFSGDIMGYTNDVIEQTIGGTSLFINADAGDVDPSMSTRSSRRKVSLTTAKLLSPVLACPSVPEVQ